MSSIGKVGGAKRANHPDRIEMARKAAAARWNKAKRLSIDNANHESNEKMVENKV